MTTTPASQPAATSTIARSRKPETSLMMLAPASTHAARDLGMARVDRDRHASSDAKRTTTGRTRASSAATGTGSAPGRVDSPPTSRIAAPSAMRRSARSDRGGRVVDAAAVGERVGRDVEDAHDERPVERELEAAAAPDGRGRADASHARRRRLVIGGRGR